MSSMVSPMLFRRFLSHLFIPLIALRFNLPMRLCWLVSSVYALCFSVFKLVPTDRRHIIVHFFGSQNSVWWGVCGFSLSYVFISPKWIQTKKHNFHVPWTSLDTHGNVGSSCCLKPGFLHPTIGVFRRR